MSAKQKPATPRAPANIRPSAKQSGKSGVARDDLMECNFCGRRFAADRLQKHEDICSKTGKKKRKVYDATKHRVVGTELESYVLRGQKGRSGTSTKSKQTSKKDWRRTHEEFIAAIRAAKQTQAHLAKGGKLSDLPPPPPSSNPDYVQCPHCGRRFNQAAAERHIPKCVNFQFNKPKPKAAGKR
ncbi:zinc finger C2HC domain-containing protein 1C-like isoform X2 [Anoplophora glabripennis]|uniref:zinc finger C2HC domain-containing protein 1C-like isoform X2 n=1 Tax=Anoplophora glabripennis TaxID=217634 RepID=UPI0008748582|nr:zinc finger C2HC domain-containing protein 1C-like isoform X2 [Anoplophora glabripennis]